MDNDHFYSRFSFNSEHTHDHALKPLWMENTTNCDLIALGGKNSINLLKQLLVEIEKKKQNKLLNNMSAASEEQMAAQQVGNMCRLSTLIIK